MTAACQDLHRKLLAEETVFVTTLQYPSRRELLAARARERTRRANLAALRVALPLLEQRAAEMAEAIKVVLVLTCQEPKSRRTR